MSKGKRIDWGWNSRWKTILHSNSLSDEFIIVISRERELEIEWFDSSTAMFNDIVEKRVIILDPRSMHWWGIEIE